MHESSFIAFIHYFIVDIILVNKLEINRKTASKYLKELEENDILKHIQIGKEILYINNELMEILKR
jgi:ribosomal protein S25